MKAELPLISCVCITRGKPKMLERAIGCYLGQTYPNKELVIVYEEDDGLTRAFMESRSDLLRAGNILSVPVQADPKIPLGGLRNTGIDAANGTVICQWDDDDWYHAGRLSDQYEAMTVHGRDGCILSQWLVYDAVSHDAYISNKRRWEGSILCTKKALQEKRYEDKSIGEDTATVDYLYDREKLYTLDNTPQLYIYIYHGGNTWNHQHWSFIFKCSTRLSPEDSMRIKDILNGGSDVRSGSLLLDEILKHERQAKSR